MTQQEILEYNKRCAEFLGWKYITHQEATLKGMKPGWWIDIPVTFHTKYHVDWYKGRSHNDLRFHLDWNCIMEVVEKIQTLDSFGGIVMIQQGRCKITSRMAGDNSVYADVSHYFVHGMKKQKEAVVEAINKFLIWYEQNKTS